MPERVPPLLWRRSGRHELVLPAHLVRHLEPPELDAVIAHELAHAARRDPWVRWLEVDVAHEQQARPDDVELQEALTALDLQAIELEHAQHDLERRRLELLEHRQMLEEKRELERERERLRAREEIEIPLEEMSVRLERLHQLGREGEAAELEERMLQMRKTLQHERQQSRQLELEFERKAIQAEMDRLRGELDRLRRLAESGVTAR